MADEKRSLDEEFWWACSNGELEKVQELKGKGVAVLFPGNKGAINCYLTKARRLPPPTAPRCPS